METSFYGKNICNLLSNLIIEQYNLISKSHITSINVTFNGQFYVLNGKTTIQSPLNYSKIFREYFDVKSVKNNTFNVIDLIEYNKDTHKEFLYLNITHKETDFLDFKTYTDSELQGCYFIDNINKTFRTNNIKLYDKITEDNKYSNYMLLDYTDYLPFVSEPFFGLSLSYEKVYETYLKYISHHIFQKQLCKQITYYVLYEGDINNLNWETMSFNITCTSPFISVKSIRSLILDIFDFNYVNIKKHLSLDTYNFENEIVSSDRCWTKRDKIKDMIII